MTVLLVHIDRSLKLTDFFQSLSNLKCGAQSQVRVLGISEEKIMKFEKSLVNSDLLVMKMLYLRIMNDDSHKSNFSNDGRRPADVPK